MEVVVVLEDVEGVFVAALLRNIIRIWVSRFDKRLKTDLHRPRSQWTYQILKDFERSILFLLWTHGEN